MDLYGCDSLDGLDHDGDGKMKNLVPCDEAIAAVLMASDGHFGRIFDGSEVPVRAEEQPWFYELRRVIAERGEVRVVERSTRYHGVVGACEMSCCPVSARTRIIGSGNPRLTCPSCGRDVGTIKTADGWQVAVHAR